MPGDPRIRASDADRDRTARRRASTTPRAGLTAEEFGERMDAALDAKTLGEIDDLLTDLPVIDLYRLPDEGMRRAPGTPAPGACRDRAVPPACRPAGYRGHRRRGPW